MNVDSPVLKEYNILNQYSMSERLRSCTRNRWAHMLGTHAFKVQTTHDR
jgi:hypothetical protein